jgi:hypothetical protein
MLRERLEVQNITEGTLLAAAFNFVMGPSNFQILLECLRDNNGDMQRLVTHKVIKTAIDNRDDKGQSLQMS